MMTAPNFKSNYAYYYFILILSKVLIMFTLVLFFINYKCLYFIINSELNVFNHFLQRLLFIFTLAASAPLEDHPIFKTFFGKYFLIAFFLREFDGKCFYMAESPWFNNIISYNILRLRFFCDESEKCIYARQERTSVRGKTIVPP